MELNENSQSPWCLQRSRSMISSTTPMASAVAIPALLAVLLATTRIKQLATRSFEVIVKEFGFMAMARNHGLGVLSHHFRSLCYSSFRHGVFSTL